MSNYDRVKLYPDFTLTADNCSEEPIHRPVAIHSDSMMLVMDVASAPTLLAVSDNLATHFGLSLDALWAKPNLSWLPPSIRDVIDNAQRVSSLPKQLPDALTLEGQNFCVTYHRHEGRLVFDFEGPADTAVETGAVTEVARAFRQCENTESLYALSTKLIAESFGYDRVMLYKFSPDLHGSVVGEHKLDRLEPFLGLHYPATDIPKMARDLFLLNKSRIIPDVNAPVAYLTFNPAIDSTIPHLDLSFSQVRATSPIHIEYLQNMGVGATLTLAVIFNNQLWGLFACHHYSPRRTSQEHRLIGEIMADMLAKRIFELDSQRERTLEDQNRQIESRLLEKIQISDQYRIAITQNAPQIGELCSSDGAVLVTLDKPVYKHGNVPSDKTLLAIRDWLTNKNHNEIFHTDHFGQDVPVDIGSDKPIGGMLAACLSTFSQSYFLWFRSPVSQHVNWAGDPNNSVVVEEASDGKQFRLSPRQSFAKWRQTIEGQSLPWERRSLDMADRIRQGLFKIELRHTAKLVEQSNKDFMQLTFSAAHDLQEPLRTQLNFIDLLNEAMNEGDSSEFPFFTSRLSVSTHRMQELVTDLLDYSRLSVSNSLKETDLNVIMEQIRDELEGVITETKTTLKVEHLPTILCDSSKIHQLLQNLMTNAIKYVSAGVDPNISVFSESSDDFVTINVKDNGIGIDPQFHKKIFTMFQRLHSREEYNGTGIGLAVCAKVAETMGAEIGVTSSLGQGSTFWLRIHGSQKL